ncbi:MAG: pyridoxal-phosphate dependent enzyme [Acidobacteriota bacterium]|nr:pyridoxal-phosphate dependent enzyme [Acidobacteriota bacterium]
MSRAISLDTIRAAAPRVYAVARRTPLVRLFPAGMTSRADGSPGSPSSPEIWLKLETLQPIGAFKIRGAANAVALLPEGAAKDGVWTVSAGNAAQGVALAAREAGYRCSVLVMDTAPAAKLDAIRRLGATIVQAPYEECWRTVETHASDRMTGCFIHPFDDDAFISGNGTAGLEILEELPDVDAIVASVGGGGLLAGIGCAVKALEPRVTIYSAEPETAAPLDASFKAGRPVTFTDWKASFVDGAGGRSVLPSMWPLLQAYVDETIVVGLAATKAAMKLTAERCHVIAEGAGACAIAAALSDRMRDAGHRRVVAVVSGGNIDLSRFAELVAS